MHIYLASLFFLTSFLFQNLSIFLPLYFLRQLLLFYIFQIDPSIEDEIFNNDISAVLQVWLVYNENKECFKY